jgi:protein-S-isoprenylcysteine O-methyltransferase Ste14
MRATRFEFQHRFWIISLIITAGFLLFFLDHTNFAVALLHLLAPSTNSDSARGILLLRCIFAFGALLIFLAALLRTWATAYLRTEVVHDSSQHSESLLADGPFRQVRNPLYLGNLLMVAGMGFMASRLGWLFMVVGMWLIVYRLILREEEGLRQTQGEPYQAYCNAVPRLWPSLTPRVPASGASPHWGQALAGELLFWFFALSLLCFAVTLNLKLTGVFFVSAFVLYFAVVPILVKKGSSRSPAKP